MMKKNDHNAPSLPHIVMENEMMKKNEFNAPSLHPKDSIPEESNNDLIDNVKGQEKANEDVQELYAKKIDNEPIFAQDAQGIATNETEAQRMVTAKYNERLENAKNEYKALGGKADYKWSIKQYKKGIQASKAKKEYQKLGGKNDYGENIKDYKTGIQALEAKKQYMELGGNNDHGENIEEYKTDIQALEYKKMLKKKGSKLTDAEKEEIFDFHNANYEPPIADENKLSVKALKDAFNFKI